MPISPKFDYKELLDIVIRRNKFIVLSSLVCALIGATLFVNIPKTFQSTTTILIIPQRVPESYVRSTISLRIEDRLASMRQQIMSRTRLLALIEELKLFDRKTDKRSDEELVEQVRKRIELQVRGNDSFVLSFTHRDRQLAMLTTSKLASYFIDENLRIREQQAVGTSDFLESQLQEMKSKLENQENIVKQYRMKYMGQLPQQLDANISALNRLQDQYRSISDSIRSTEDRMAFYQSQLSSLPKPQKSKSPSTQAATERSGERPIETPGATMSDQALIREFRNKQARLAELSTKYTENYPEIISLKRDLNRLEKEIIAAGYTSPDSTTVAPELLRDPASVIEAQRHEQEEQRLTNQINSSRLELISLRKQIKEIEKNIADLQERVDASPKREQELFSINRDYENLKLSYNEMLRKKLDAQVSANLEKQQKGAQFQIVDPPNLPESPVSPAPKVFIMGTLFFSCVISIGGAFVIEYFNKTINAKEYFVKHFDLPVLVSLPMLPDPIWIRKKWKNDIIFAFISFMLVFFILAVLYYGVVLNA